MKKLIVILALTLAPVQAFAIIATLPLQITQNLEQFVQDATANLQLAVETVTKYTTMAMKIKQFIDDPMMALVGANTGKQIELETKKWLAGGAQSDPLLIKNPEAYLKNTQTNALRQQIAIIEASKNHSPASESIITSLIQRRRAQVNPGSAMPKDRSPETIQKSLCANNGEAVRSIAEDQVGTLLSQSGPSDADVRFQELYSTYCEGDPNTDKALAQKLLTLSKSGAYFSWDNWLLTTGGNNDYSIAMQTQLEIDRRAREQLALADKEVSAGYMADTKCIEFMKNDDDGNPYPEGTAPCLSRETTKPAETVKSIADQLDINTLLKPLFTAAQQKPLAQDALAGLGDMFSGLANAAGVIQQVAQTGQAVGNLVGQVNTLTGTLQYAGSALFGSGSANTSQVNFLGTTNTTYRSSSSTYVNVSHTATSSEVSDGSTPEQLSASRDPLLQALRDHQSAMSKVPGLLTQIDPTANQYQSSISTVNSCIQDIKNTNSYDQSRVSDFQGRMQSKITNLLNPVINTLSFTRNKTPITNSYLSGSVTAVTNSRNISAILALFQEYKNLMTNNSILPSDIDARLDAVSKQVVPALQNDISGVNDDATGNNSLKRLIEDCQNYLNSLGGLGSPSGGE